ncbi:MAG: large conductance mechanosensitive channel [Bacteroidales bacterium]|jgi:large conductance mechanosensitive channel|nr:large conductance mechanosensitive channel [Bacteroidales bacterium]MDN5328914.1 large conductance mechanosensitive channel [Bacteroidales bacterium]NLH52669.1 large-conductance mechanosensitive channel protein MscL [Bacteroidales bacterium]NPV35191.1 large-conductance mechanosensitive channel protein MscL [Bacteroidales bacterium]
MSILKEFKAFAMRGNVVDMAVGIIIGGAFGKIVSSLVNDVIMPPLGLLIGGVNFTDLKITLKQAATAADGSVIPAVSLQIGSFIQTLVDFTIIAFAIFLMIKGMNALNRKTKQEPAPPAPPQPTNEEKLLAEIRDLLKDNAKR